MEQAPGSGEPILVALAPWRRLNRRRSAQMAEMLERLIQPGVRLVLEMSPAEEVDSDGLAMVLGLARRIDRLGGELKICGLSPRARAFFEVAQVHRRIDICNDLNEAIRAFVRAFD